MLDREEQKKMQREIDKSEEFLLQYSAYDVSRADPRSEKCIIEIHQDFSWEDALSYFFERLRWILKALRSSMIIPNTEELGIQYIKVQVGTILDGANGIKSANQVRLVENFKTYFSKQHEIREIMSYKFIEAHSAFLLQIYYFD